MKYSIDHVIASALPNVGKTVLGDIYNGIFESTLKGVDINIFSAKDFIYHEFKHDKYPDNVNILERGIAYLPSRIEPSVIMLHSRQDNLFKFLDIARQYHLNVILFEHELPLTKVKPNIRKYINSRINKNVIHVYPHTIVKDEWYLDDNKKIIHLPYGIPDLRSDIEKDIDVLVLGDYGTNDDLLDVILGTHKNTVGVGYNYGRTQEYESIDALHNMIKRAKVCISVYNDNQPPFYAMLAASAGAVPICNKTRWVDSIFPDEVIFKDVGELKRLVDSSLADYQHIATPIQTKILHSFDHNTFKKSLEYLIHSVSKQVFKL